MMPISTNLKAGFVDFIEQSEFDELRQKQPMIRVKAGFDPTAPDLHLGHAVLLRKLRQFQNAGHTVVMIVGNATALIGDPTGRNTLRPPLTEDEINGNAWTYMAQAKKILDSEKTILRKNYDWFSEFAFLDMIRLLSNFTLAQILQRADFKSRFESQTPIHLHELVYPLLQAYDSFREGVDMELGGTDQLFNLMMGREYMRLRGEKPQIIATVPLLVGTDGQQKMSKSLGNHIALNDDPFEMYSKVMSISDQTMRQWWSTLFWDLAWSATGEAEAKLPPMQSKHALAFKIVSWLHTEPLAYRAANEWTQVFSERQKPTDINTVRCDITHPNVNMRLDKLLVLTGMAPSTTEAGRLIKAGAVDVNDTRATDNRIAEVWQQADIRVGRKWIRIQQG